MEDDPLELLGIRERDLHGALPALGQHLDLEPESTGEMAFECGHVLVQRKPFGSPHAAGRCADRDLSVAWVYFNSLDGQQDRETLEKAFASALGFLRIQLASQLTVRHVPERRRVLE